MSVTISSATAARLRAAPAEIGERIRAARKAQKLSMRAVAERTSGPRGRKVHFSTIDKFEKGTRCLSVDWLLAIADGLGVTVDHLLGQPMPQVAPSPRVVAAFAAWRDSELAGHYMAPATDEALDAQIAITSAKRRELAALPAQNAADLLLKLLPAALILHDPFAWEPPLAPVVRPELDTDYDEDEAWRGIIADLPRLSPLIAEAVAVPASPHYREREAAYKAKQGLAA